MKRIFRKRFPIDFLWCAIGCSLIKLTPTICIVNVSKIQKSRCEIVHFAQQLPKYANNMPKTNVSKKISGCARCATACTNVQNGDSPQIAHFPYSGWFSSLRILLIGRMLPAIITSITPATCITVPDPKPTPRPVAAPTASAATPDTA